ncbi:MAG: esterase-like activity of phytase family protein [Polyangiales bacterium]
MRASTALVVASLLASAACTKKEPRGPGRIVTLDTDVAGLSGLTIDEHGAFWAPGEAGDAIIRIDPEHFGVTRYPAVGGPAGTDLEAMAWLDGTRFLIGTETQERGRLQDVILEARLHGTRAEVATVGKLEYARWQLAAPDNRGIEGVCHLDGVLVFATELVERQRGQRWAPLGVFDPKTQAWTAHRVRLTSKTGKLAAMSCRVIDGVIVALAVERHFGVSRLLRFHVPQGLEPQWIESSVAADLDELVSPLPNFEGLVWLDDGSAVVVTDNRYRGATGEPSRLYFIPVSAMR